MTERADAHIHLFEGGFPRSFTGRPGVVVDEAQLYGSFAQEYDVRKALIVGFAARAWCVDNNAWIESAARTLPWACPLAYFDSSKPPTIDELETLRNGGFVGLSTYISDESASAALGRIPGPFWSWLVERRWLVSVNSRGDLWRGWIPILDRFGNLRLLTSHLGSPDTTSQGSPAEILSTVLALAAYPGPRVKLSGFYALTRPQSEYPHRSTWPLVETLVQRFGPDRLLWGSDCTPALDHVSFPQTFGVFAHMDFLDGEDQTKIEGQNLIALLDEAKR